MSSGRRCPIPGCPHVYERTLSGWLAHVGTFAKHPEWHPSVDAPKERRAIFLEEFPQFLVDPPQLQPTPCPLPGCKHQMARGMTGWYQHIALPTNHPTWHPELGPKERTAFFRKQFAHLFPEGRTTMPPSRKRSRLPPTTVAHGNKRVAAPAVQAPNSGVAPVMRCPLRGCDHQYESGVEGWESHVGNWDLHPGYLREIASPTMRAQMYRRDFPGWFDQAITPGPFDAIVISAAKLG